MKLVSLLRLVSIAVASVALNSAPVFAASTTNPVKVFTQPGTGENLGKASGVNAQGGGSVASVSVDFDNNTTASVMVNVVASAYDWQTAHALADALNQDNTFRASGLRAVPGKIAGDPAWYVLFTKHTVGVRITCVTAGGTDTKQAISA